MPNHRFAAGKDHGWAVLIACNTGADGGVAGVGEFGGAWRGRPSSRYPSDAVRLDKRASGRSIRGDRRLSPALAAMVQRRRGASIALNFGAGPIAGQRRAGAGNSERRSKPAGREPAQLDIAAIGGRDRAANRHQHFEIQVEHPAAAKRGFRWRRPRHTLNGRQDANAVDRVGLRLRLREAQAEAGDIVLLYADESEALTHPYLAHAWAKQGADLRVAAPGQSRKVAMMGALDATTRELLVHTSLSKCSVDFIGMLEMLDRRFGPRPSRTVKPVVLVLDNGPVHTSKATTAALAARPWIAVEWLPRYAPELNKIEVVWRDLKRHHLAHQTFLNCNALDTAIHAAVANLNKERQAIYPCAKLRIAA